MGYTLRFRDAGKVPRGSEFPPLRNSPVPGKRESHFTHPWDVTRPQAWPSSSASLFRAWLCHPTHSQARIKSCSFYHLTIFWFHSLLPIAPPLSPPRTSFYLLSAQLQRRLPSSSTCTSLRPFLKHSLLCRQSDGLKVRGIPSPPSTVTSFLIAGKRQDFRRWPGGLFVSGAPLNPSSLTSGNSGHTVVKGKPRGRFKQ